MYFYTDSGRVELQLTLDQAKSASHQGSCDDDIASLRKVPAVRRQLDKLDSALLASELKKWGCWSEADLSDHDANLNRILWLACCDIREEHYTKS